MSIAVLRTFIAKRKEEHASKFCRENVNDPLKSHQELKEPMVLEVQYIQKFFLGLVL